MDTILKEAEHFPSMAEAGLDAKFNKRQAKAAQNAKSAEATSETPEVADASDGKSEPKVDPSKQSDGPTHPETPTVETPKVESPSASSNESASKKSVIDEALERADRTQTTYTPSSKFQDKGPSPSIDV